MPSAKKFLQRFMLLASRPRPSQGRVGQLLQRDREEAVTVEGMILERIRSHVGLVQVALGKAVAIDDQNAVGAAGP